MTTTITTTQAARKGSATAIGTDPRHLPRLIDWLYQAAARRNETRSEMARQLGVTYGYLNQLATGMRAVENITADFARSAARYLDIPAVAVMVAAGRIRMEDFLLPEQSRTPTRQLAEGLQRIAADPLVGALLPDEAWDVPDSVKGLLIALYEDATKRELFPPRQLPMILQGLQDATLVIDELDAAKEGAITADFLASQESTDA